MPYVQNAADKTGRTEQRVGFVFFRIAAPFPSTLPAVGASLILFQRAGGIEMGITSGKYKEGGRFKGEVSRRGQDAKRA